MADEISSPSLIARMMRGRMLSSTRVCVQDLESPANEHATRLHHAARPWQVPGRFDARALWKRSWPELRKLLKQHDRPGVLVVGLRPDAELTSHAWVASSWKHTRSLIVGRHGCCDLVVPGAMAELSLRHLAILVRGVNRDEASITVLDLRSGLGFSDESGRVMHALRAEGPLFVRVGPLVLAFLVTEQAGTWPEDADDAYDLLPERVFLGEQSVHYALPLGGGAVQGRDGQASMSHARDFDEDHGTSVTRLPALLDPRKLVVDDGQPVIAELLLRRAGKAQTLPITQQALSRGVLIGRYDRCDGSQVLGHCSSISRVHALLIDVGDGPMLVDTASTYGVTVGGEAMREVHLSHGLDVDLASEVRMTWRVREP